MPTTRGGLTVLLAAALGAVLGVGPVTPAHADPATRAADAPFALVRARLGAPRPAVTDPAVAGVWRDGFADLRLSGPAGVSVVPVGSARGLTVGPLRTGVAWSTAKVPLGVAALDRRLSAKERRKVERLVHAAITRSDNAAAERLWRKLGSGRTAARTVQQVIRSAGDRDTVVQHRRVRRGFSAYGQTRWALDDQAQFAAGFACLSQGARVRREMGKIVGSQSLGLGRLARTRFKGGWGPVKGGYLVRQVGMVRAADGRQWGVAIMVRSGNLSRGSRDLTTIARWLDRRLDGVSGGGC